MIPALEPDSAATPAFSVTSTDSSTSGTTNSVPGFPSAPATSSTGTSSDDQDVEVGKLLSDLPDLVSSPVLAPVVVPGALILALVFLMGGGD